MKDKDSSPPARLLIVDDHSLIREGMRTMLSGAPDLEVVGEAADGREAVELCRKLRPDLVLMDLRMPRMDGLTATRAIKEEHPATIVLVVTTYESPEHLLDAIMAGAAGYITKDATRQQMLAAVRGVLGGESTLDQELAMRLIRELASEQASRRPGQEPLVPVGNQEEGQASETFTAREIEVLRLLARGKTNREISQELHLSLSTIKVNVQRIISKLGVSDRTQAAVKAAKLGLLPGQ